MTGNLKGKQKPQYLIDAIEAEEKAHKLFLQYAGIYEDKPTRSNKITMARFSYLWATSESHLRFCQNRYGMEQRQCASIIE
jgi:hypothetical protein